MMDGNEALRQWAAKIVMRGVTTERSESLALRCMKDTHRSHPEVEALFRKRPK